MPFVYLKTRSQINLKFLQELGRHKGNDCVASYETQVRTDFVITARDLVQPPQAVILPQIFGQTMVGSEEPWFLGLLLQNLWFDSLSEEKLAELNAKAFDLSKR